MKGMQFQCIYEIDDDKYPFVAFNHQGQLFGFQNPPVRDYANLEWVDSATGDPGDLIPFLRWDVSMREPKDFADIHRKIPLKGPSESLSVYGKKYKKFKRNEDVNG